VKGLNIQIKVRTDNNTSFLFIPVLITEIRHRQTDAGFFHYLPSSSTTCGRSFREGVLNDAQLTAADAKRTDNRTAFNEFIFNFNII
jgi:hypothetical protein